MLSVTRIEQSLAVVAHLSEGIPRYWLLDSSALEAAGTVARPVGQLADMGAQGRDGGGCPVCLGSFSERDHQSKANRPAMLHAMRCG